MNKFQPVLALAKKELRLWFYSPLFYGTGVFLIVFLSIWLYYYQVFFALDSSALRPFFSAFPLSYIFIIPVITMKSWAEEKKSGTAELLFTMPLSDWELVTAKFVSSFSVLIIYIFLTLPIPLSIMPLGRFDIGVLFSEYTGVILLGACACSVGLFLSNLSKNQAAAFISTAVVLLIMIFLNTFVNRFVFESGLVLLLRGLLNFFSLSYHFESFSRGIFDSRDIAFFIIGTIFFLFLSERILFFRKSRTLKNKKNIFMVFLCCIIFLLSFLISSGLYFRLDMTKNKSYTLSGISKNLFREIDDVLRITYFVSDSLVSSHPLPMEITGFLQEYAAGSRGKIIFSVKDPQKTNMTGDMEYLGIIPQIIRVIENNEIVTMEVFTGITIEYMDRIEILPVVFSRETLEYDITGRILSLVRGIEREVGVIIGNSSKYWNTDFILLDSQLRHSGFRVRVLVQGEEIPDNLPVLFVFGGADEFDEWTLYRIDRYIQCGGNVLFTQESIAVDFQNSLEAKPVVEKGLFAMLACYGAAILPGMVMDRSALQISYQESVVSQNQTTIPYPMWITVLEQNTNRLHPVTRSFFGLNLYWASPVELYPPPGVVGEILFTSSPEAWLQTRNYSADPLLELRADNAERESEAVRTMGVKILGVSLSGIFPSFFEGAPKPLREGSSVLPDMPAIAAPSKIIVVGDTDFAGSLMEIGSSETGNLKFLVDAADWLSSIEELSQLRHESPGRLDRISDIEKRLALMNFSRILNLYIMPFVIFITGLIVTGKRRSKTSGTKLLNEKKEKFNDKKN